MNIAFIPVRGGSKSIPLKNIKFFCGKPLVYWTLNAAQQSKKIDKIIVATDSDEIKKTVNSFGFKKVEVYDRNSKNATDEASTEDVMLEYLDKSNLKSKDIFILLQATSPMTEAKDIDSAFSLIIAKNVDSVLSCVRQKYFLWNDNNSPFNYDYRNRPRRQDHSGILVENGALYISSVKSIKKTKNRLGGKIAVYEMEDFKNIDLDEEFQWLPAEIIMKRNILKCK